MQIYIKFTCRECGQDQEVRTDTADYYAVINPAHVLELRCRQCGHVSGELGLGYRYQEQHRPSWEAAHYPPV